MRERVWDNSTMDIYAGGTCENDEEVPCTIACEVRFQGSTIVLSYVEDRVHVVYQGREEEPGHYRLEATSGVTGSGTLHRFSNEETLEGRWAEEGELGMWAIHLDRSSD